MTKLVRVEGEKHLFRDESSGAIVNINKDELKAARYAKQLRREKEAEHKKLVEDVKELKDDIGDIKDLLKKMIEK